MFPFVSLVPSGRLWTRFHFGGIQSPCQHRCIRRNGVPFCVACRRMCRNCEFCVRCLREPIEPLPRTHAGTARGIPPHRGGMTRSREATCVAGYSGPVLRAGRHGDEATGRRNDPQWERKYGSETCRPTVLRSSSKSTGRRQFAHGAQQLIDLEGLVEERDDTDVLGSRMR